MMTLARWCLWPAPDNFWNEWRRVWRLLPRRRLRGLRDWGLGKKSYNLFWMMAWVIEFTSFWTVKNYVNIFVKQCLSPYSVASAKQFKQGHLQGMEVDLAEVLKAAKAKNMVLSFAEGCCARPDTETGRQVARTSQVASFLFQCHQCHPVAPPPLYFL